MATEVSPGKESPWFTFRRWYPYRNEGPRKWIGESLRYHERVPTETNTPPRPTSANGLFLVTSNLSQRGLFTDVWRRRPEQKAKGRGGSSQEHRECVSTVFDRAHFQSSDILLIIISLELKERAERRSTQERRLSLSADGHPSQSSPLSLPHFVFFLFFYYLYFFVRLSTLDESPSFSSSSSFLVSSLFSLILTRSSTNLFLVLMLWPIVPFRIRPLLLAHPLISPRRPSRKQRSITHPLSKGYRS